MSNKRNLKKDITYVAGELFSEVLLCKLYIPGTDHGKTEVLMSRILDMQSDFIARAGCPDGKDNPVLVREYYRKLRVDLQTEVNAIGIEIASLNK